jgi:hypothetical protein
MGIPLINRGIGLDCNRIYVRFKGQFRPVAAGIRLPAIMIANVLQKS